MWVEHIVSAKSIHYTIYHPFSQSSVFSHNHNWRTGSTANLYILLPPRAKQCLWLNNKTVNTHCSITKRRRRRRHITYVTSTVSINLLLQSTISVITIISFKDYAFWELYRLAADHWRSSIFPLSYCLQYALHRLSIQLCILMDMYSAGICAVLLLLLHSITWSVSVRRTRLHCSLKHVYLQHPFAWHANCIRRPSFSILWARLLMGSQTPTDRPTDTIKNRVTCSTGTTNWRTRDATVSNTVF